MGYTTDKNRKPSAGEAARRSAKRRKGGKPWMCRYCGEVLGSVHRQRYGTVLVLAETGYLVKDANATVPCPKCGRTRHWKQHNVL